MAITAGSEEPDPPPEPMSEEVKDGEAGVRGVGTDVSWEAWLGELEAGVFLGGGQESRCESIVGYICAI